MAGVVVRTASIAVTRCLGVNSLLSCPREQIRLLGRKWLLLHTSAGSALHRMSPERLRRLACFFAGRHVSNGGI